MMFQRSASVDKRVPKLIDSWRSQMQQVRLKEQAYINKLSKEMQDRIAKNREDLDMTLKQQHMQEMYRLEEEHAKNMNDLKLSGSIDKATHNLAAGDAKREQATQAKALDAAAQQKKHEDDIQRSREKAAVEIAAKKTQAELKIAESKIKLEQQAKQKEKDTTNE